MTTLSSATKFFSNPTEGFTTTTSGSVSSGATTVGLNSVSGYTNGDTVCLVIEPTSSTAKQVFTGVIDTSGVQVTGVVWTEGTNQSHAAGVTVVDYVTASHLGLMTKGLLVAHSVDGTHKSGATYPAAILTSSPTLTTPTIADLTNMNHTHLTTAQGGRLTGSATQMVYSLTTAQTTGTTTIPLDTTIPQSNEGDQYMTLAITPRSATNILVIESNFIGSHGAAAFIMTQALFQDSTANALAVSSIEGDVSTEPVSCLLKHVMVAGTTSATTFKIRAGANVGGTTTFNGFSGIGADTYGATTKSSMTITEYVA